MLQTKTLLIQQAIWVAIILAQAAYISIKYQKPLHQQLQNKGITIRKWINSGHHILLSIKKSDRQRAKELLVSDLEIALLYGQLRKNMFILYIIIAMSVINTMLVLL